ncbi:MAG: tRNA (N6-isopentenyl adenosine(37)-C2)-methylthiotransferase MiaB [Oscillospiraceae bacterium]|jgi:tRNA-2-methylthio-N6-dimethylallyladenosine synthase|nr:tRNA (N6-isopentenyl adenosine(37)-C2)-methylthiotransferase MiaB [Oscillospiraceae bacterium]
MGYAPEQQAYVARLRALFGGADAPPLAFVDTYGCQQNEADSERLRGMLFEMGCGFTTREEEADLIVINTCAVREHAEMRVLGNVGALIHTKRNKPRQLIALCGCMMQSPEVVEKVRRSYRHVDLVFGPHALPRFPELLWRALARTGRIFDRDEGGGPLTEGLPVYRAAPPRAWVSIMYGCDNFCSYCIVPHVRGRERSRSPEAVLEEVFSLVRGGYTELTLLGQNVNSYGKGLAPPTDFAALLASVCRVPGDFTVGFMTSHPKDATCRMLDVMAENPKIRRHLHLPFQSGSDRILRAMGRGYTRASYERLIDDARARMPDLNLTSDVIVGFPGETEADFADTLSLLARVRFHNLFTFIYSKRPGTPAADLPDDTPPAVKRERMARLLALQRQLSAGERANGKGTG